MFCFVLFFFVLNRMTQHQCITKFNKLFPQVSFYQLDLEVIEVFATRKDCLMYG